MHSKFICYAGAPHSPPLEVSPPIGRKVPGETTFLHHLLDFVITRPAPEVLPGGPAPFFLPEGADQRAVLPSPSRFRYERTCLRGLSRQPCSFFLPRRCRPKRSFSVTFSFSLCVNPRQRRLLVALRRFLAGKVPGQVTFLHHLLGFVISRPAPEASLAILAPDSHPEGAGQVPFARHLLVLVSSIRLHLPHSKAFPLTSSLLPKEPCFPAIRPLLLKESAQSFFSPDSLRFLIRNVGSFIAFSSHLPKVCSFPRFYLTFQRWDFCKCVPQAM